MLPYELEHLFSYSAQLQPPEIIGPVAEGIRANFYVASGEVSGPRVQGILRPVGGDWLTVAYNGIAGLPTVNGNNMLYVFALGGRPVPPARRLPDAAEYEGAIIGTQQGER